VSNHCLSNFTYGWKLHEEQCFTQKYSRLRCLLRVKCLVICFYLGWSGSILQFRQSIIKVGSKSWLLTCSNYLTLSLPSYTGSALKRELNFCNGYLSLLYFWFYHIFLRIWPMWKYPLSLSHIAIFMAKHNFFWKLLSINILCYTSSEQFQTLFYRFKNKSCSQFWFKHSFCQINKFKPENLKKSYSPTTNNVNVVVHISNLLLETNLVSTYSKKKKKNEVTKWSLNRFVFLASKNLRCRAIMYYYNLLLNS